MSAREGISIDEFSLESAEYGSTVQPIYYRQGDISREQLGGGTDHGVVVVSINVDDGECDRVTMDLHQTGDLAALDRVLEIVQAVRDELARLYGDRPHRLGRCLETGDTGRCKYRLDHESNHEFPTEAECDATIHALAQRQAV